MEVFIKPPKPKVKSSSEGEVTLASIDAKLDMVLSELSALKVKMNKLEGIQKEQQQSIEYIMAENEELKEKLVLLENQQPTIQTKLKSLENLNNRVEQHEHLSRAKCVELNGIPYSKDENLTEGFERLVKKVENFHLNLSTDLDNIYRIKQCKRVIIKFTQTKKRDQFFQLYRKNLCSTTDVGFKESSRIYINEELSREQSALFWKARGFKKDHNFKYIWTFGQKIYLRKTPDSDAVLINSEEDLEALICAK